MEWLQANYGMIFMLLFGLCELLANIPYFKSNSVFQLIFNLLKKLKPSSPQA